MTADEFRSNGINPRLAWLIHEDHIPESELPNFSDAELSKVYTIAVTHKSRIYSLLRDRGWTDEQISFGR